MSGDAAAGGLTQRTAWNTAVRSVGGILGKLATLAWTIAAVRLLDQQEVGGLFYALNVMLIASALPTWGFDSGLIHRASRESDALPRLNTQVMALKTVIGVPAFLLAGGLAAMTRPSDQATVVLLLFLVAGFPEMWSHTARATASARQSPLGVSAALVLQRLVTAAAILVVLIMQGGVVAVAAMFLLGTLVGWLAHARAVRGLGVRPSLRLLSRDGVIKLLRETWLVGCSGIVLMMLFRADTLFLAAIDGDEAVAVYVVAYRLLETVLFVSHAINQSIFPVMSASVGGTRARKGLEQGVALASFVYLPFAVVCLLEASRVIGLLFGETYADQSAPVLMWLGPAAILFSAAFFMSTALMSRERWDRARCLPSPSRRHQRRRHAERGAIRHRGGAERGATSA